jgi:hypothetical protein
MSLGSTSNPKNKSVNAGMFIRYYNDLQESIANTWWITPEAVAQYQGISKFKATRHRVWIQAWKDPKNQWIQLRYCIKDWHDDWRIPDLNQDMLADKEVDAGQEKTLAGDKRVPKKPNIGHNLAQQKKGGVSKKGT